MHILERTTKFDRDCAALADLHYFRETPGSPQFMPPGETVVLRDADGLVVFGWVVQLFRWDGQQGACCAIFRNESKALSSEIILEAERFALERWGEIRAFTYVDPKKIRSRNPGYCFKVAGWNAVERRADGKIIMEKYLS